MHEELEKDEFLLDEPEEEVEEKSVDEDTDDTDLGEEEEEV
jgi:hypothetical protein